MNLRLREWASKTEAPAAAACVRFVVGLVFWAEGVQKLLYPATLGVARFARIGIPAPAFSAPFVGTVEIVFGLLLIFGFLTRLAAIPLLGVISVAICTTKIPMLLHAGFWPAIHEARTDLAMFFCLIFLLIAGGGGFSLDARLRQRD
ncbi:MAG: DoxX family protein [Acidobacteriaceae bacterium]